MYHIVTALPSKVASLVRAALNYFEVKVYRTVILRVGLRGYATWVCHITGRK
jgi:hypothetical protein